MFLSISQQRSGYPLFLSPLQIHSVKALAQVICTNVWSPIIWKDQRRNTENFLYSDIIGLDFDEGPTLESVKKNLAALHIKSLIGLTKSHQKEKSGKPACDRFRVIIPWHQRVTDYNVYRQNLERLSKIFPGDKACKDGARIFQPCVRIDAFLDGRGYSWLPYVAPSYSAAQTSEYFKRNGIIPRYIRDMIDHPPGSGERNKHCFRIAANLSKYGFSESDCIAAVMSCAVGLPEREKLMAAKSGFKAGKK